MRLINTSNLNFKEFYKHDRPPYAILSHCWADNGEEIPFQEYRNSINDPNDKLSSLQACSGMSKILGCIAKASERGIRWVWVDTCCIDKRSSSELSEAINSMYNWYQAATECYVYLNNFEQASERPGVLLTSVEEFCNHRWFTRGWTLQELLAPKTVLFFDHDWNFIGNREDLKTQISSATKIESRYLEYPHRACVAKKMSWASGRTTSREEDLAYSLLGLFDVNMPLLYGEGGVKAFIRLQMEIVRKSEDESIFAWTSNATQSGLLSTSPSNFANSGYIERFQKNLESRQPYSMTHKGLMFHVPTLSGARNQINLSTSLHEHKTIYLALYCGKVPAVAGASTQCATIVLNRNMHTWIRTNCKELLFRDGVKPSFDSNGYSTTKIIYVAQDGM